MEDEKSGQWWGITAGTRLNSWELQLGHWQGEYKIKTILIKYDELPPTDKVEITYYNITVDQH